MITFGSHVFLHFNGISGSYFSVFKAKLKFIRQHRLFFTRRWQCYSTVIDIQTVPCGDKNDRDHKMITCCSLSSSCTGIDSRDLGQQLEMERKESRPKETKKVCSCKKPFLRRILN